MEAKTETEHGTLEPCDKCGELAYSTVHDPEHSAYHPDHKSVFLNVLSETWQYDTDAGEGGYVKICQNCR